MFATICFLNNQDVAPNTKLLIKKAGKYLDCD